MGASRVMTVILLHGCTVDLLFTTGISESWCGWRWRLPTMTQGLYCSTIWSVWKATVVRHWVSCQDLHSIILCYCWIHIGCPALIRMDHGTENGLIGTTHITFRSQHTDNLSGANSIRYGKSPANVVSFQYALWCQSTHDLTFSCCSHSGLRVGGPS